MCQDQDHQTVQRLWEDHHVIFKHLSVSDLAFIQLTFCRTPPTHRVLPFLKLSTNLDMAKRSKG